MKIQRNILGNDIEFDLTPAELLQAYEEQRRDAMTQSIVQAYDEKYGRMPDPEVIHHIFTEWKDYINSACEPGAPVAEQLVELVEDNPPKKNRYTVRATMLYSACIDVEAVNEHEAQEIAWKQLDKADWEPIDGSEEIDNVYEEE